MSYKEAIAFSLCCLVYYPFYGDYVLFVAPIAFIAYKLILAKIEDSINEP